MKSYIVWKKFVEGVKYTIQVAKKGGGGGLLLPCLAFGGVAFGKIAPNKVKHPTK